MRFDDFESLVDFCKEIGARFDTYEKNGLQQVYIYNKETYDKKKAHPVKYKDLFVEYYRLTYHDGGKLYYRDCGLTGYTSEEQAEVRILQLTGIEQ